MEVPMWLSQHLSESDLIEIEKSVKDAELKTSGEIVPILVKSSTPRYWSYVVPALITLISSMLVVSSFYVDGEWSSSANFMELGLKVLAFILFLAFMHWKLDYSSWVFPWVITKNVHKRAEKEFYLAGLDKTKDATGIMIFISFMEKRVVVLADKGISDRLAKSTWNNVVSMILKAKKEGSLAKGLKEAISECSSLLEREFPIQEDDTNELPNHLIIKD